MSYKKGDTDYLGGRRHLLSKEQNPITLNQCLDFVRLYYMDLTPIGKTLKLYIQDRNQLCIK